MPGATFFWRRTRAHVEARGLRTVGSWMRRTDGLRRGGASLFIRIETRLAAQPTLKRARSPRIVYFPGIFSEGMSSTVTPVGGVYTKRAGSGFALMSILLYTVVEVGWPLSSNTSVLICNPNSFEI